MENSDKVDKFSPIIIPNCQPTPSQESKLQSIPFVTDDSLSEKSLSSSDESSEQEAEIVMVTLPDSSDDYQTPPEHQSYSQNSSNDGQVAAVGVDRDGEGEVTMGQGVDSGNESENLGVLGKSNVRVCDYKDDGILVVDDDDDDDSDTEKIDEIENEELIVETVGTEEIDSLDEAADQVFDEMPEREQGGGGSEMVFDEMPEREEEGDTGLNLRKRKLPSTINTNSGEEDGYCKHRMFVASLDRVLKILVGEGKGEENDEEIDFVETAKMRGMRFPRPRWLPGEGLDD